VIKRNKRLAKKVCNKLSMRFNIHMSDHRVETFETFLHARELAKIQKLDKKKLKFFIIKNVR